ncbi:IclR family transcriptional regulator domain-containing protein [Microbacterium allomyrinae]|uniref:Helix-turn-helix domain-containing protein n=1 Tax=Microbacterium allomyrinae TaxID=2830666 RepID=A0A9X1LWS0_9MICO|nr:IclR family transcriptional regulator C-terminal domain-containing protein [Microbacterium allomyrinae]MCC2033183.1 helix-turn-helix domain-containing protein [Microbacterium allomyrinae]
MPGTDEIDDAELALAGGGERLEQLERAISVLEAFNRERSSLSLSEVAQLTGITRAAARRILLTLRALGHVRSDGRRFSLTPKVLNLGWGYFASLSISEIAQPIMQEVVTATEGSCSMAVLDGPDIVYVARVHTPRMMTIGGSVGSRLPASATAAGRNLLAGLDDAALDAYLADEPLEQYTRRTITDPELFRAELRTIRDQGWAIVDQELEIGLRAISVPVRGHDGQITSALSVSSNSARVSLLEIRRRSLPALQEAAATISTALLRSGH